MASGKRQPSKQKRTNQNRQERAARQARAAAANRAAAAPTSKSKSKSKGTAKPSLLGRMRSAAGGTAPNRAARAERTAERDAQRAAPVEPELDDDAYDDDEVDADDRAHDDEPTEPAGPKTLLGRLRTSETAVPSRAARQPRPVTAAAQRGATSAINKRAAAGRATPAGTRPAGGPLRNPSAQPVGYRAALTGALAAVAAVGASFLVHAPVDGRGDLYTKPSITAEWSERALDASIDAPTADPTAIVQSIDDWMPDRSSERLFVIYWPTSLAVLLPVGASILAFRAVKDRRPSKVVTRAMYATLLGSVLTVGLLQFFIPTVIAISVASFQVRKAEMAAIRAANAEGVIEADVVDDEDR